MADTGRHATLRPPAKARGARRAVRRSRLRFTAGQVTCHNLAGMRGTRTFDVVGLVDDPVDVAPRVVEDGLTEVSGSRFFDTAESEAGTLGLLLREHPPVYLYLADWWPGKLTERDARHVRRAVARRVGLPLASSSTWPTEGGRRWRPEGTRDTLGRSIVRVGGVLAGLLLVAPLLGAALIDIFDVEPPRWVLVGSVAASMLTCLATALGAHALRFVRLLREGEPEVDTVVRPSPGEPVTRRFLRRARIFRCDDEIGLRTDTGEELWLGGGDDDLGVRGAELAPDLQISGPPRDRVYLLGHDNQILAELDPVEWFGSAEPAVVGAILAPLGIVTSPERRTKRRRGLGHLLRDSRGTGRDDSLRYAGLAGPSSFAIWTLPLMVLLTAVLDGGDIDESEPFSLALVAAAATVAITVVPALVRGLVSHRWLNRDVTASGVPTDERRRSETWRAPAVSLGPMLVVNIGAVLGAVVPAGLALFAIVVPMMLIPGVAELVDGGSVLVMIPVVIVVFVVVGYVYFRSMRFIGKRLQGLLDRLSS
ncbi:hypothetical protein GCM10023169_25210 [Georgenia halophila]|uniref:Uncharacterized protein n=1 Tax=Georgenia halophila TaxID=620889 RepID=A0ABP8LCM8_9MICO